MSRKEGEEGEEEFVYKVVPNDITLKLPAARSVEDNPVHKTKILTVKENNRDIKVGYLMYNSFTAGTNSDPDKYNNELRQISQRVQDSWRENMLYLTYVTTPVVHWIVFSY